MESNKILKDYGFNVSFHTFDGGHIINPESLTYALDRINQKIKPLKSAL
jgi:predicted esterase